MSGSHVSVPATAVPSLSQLPLRERRLRAAQTARLAERPAGYRLATAADAAARGHGLVVEGVTIVPGDD